MTGRTTTTTGRLDVPDGHIAYAEAGAGAPPVVLLHAGYVDNRMWQRELAHLSERTRTVAPDARAHGGSSTPFVPFRQCDDVAALIRHLDAGPAVLVGVSMGAGTAVDTALEYPDLVRALVISGAGTNEPVFEGADLREVLARRDRAERQMDAAAWLAASLQGNLGPGRGPEDADAGFVGLLRQMQQDFVAAHVRPGVVPPSRVVGSWERLGEIAVPVLGIVGEFDYGDHHRMCERAVGAVQDGRGVVRIPGAGHLPNLEQPAAWEAAVDSFLDGIGS